MECKMAVKLIPFDAAEFLKDEETTAAYLNACMETGDPDVMLSALSAAARARGMADLADKAGVNRESLYKALAPGAKPRYDTILKVVHALGIDLVFQVPSTAKKTSTRKSTSTKVPGKALPASARRKKTPVEDRAGARADAAAAKRR
jgi:probable addiction module antidote protein